MKSKTNTFRPVLILAPGVLAGAEKVVITGITALSELGLNPLMVIIRETRIPKLAHDFQNALPAHIESVIIDSTKAFDIKLPQKLKLVLKSQTIPVVLHSHGFKALIASYMAKGKSPHIHTHHGNTAHTFKVRIYEKIAMITMKTCNEIIAVSMKMKEELLSRLNPYNRITVIENMLSLSNVAKIRNEKKMNSDPNHNIIKLIFIGRLSPEKGLLPFLECLAMFPEKNRFHLTILGDGVERSLVDKYIHQNNLSEQVTMHGFVSDPSDYLIAADLLIMPSLREGLPMTLIESLSSGVPVIANNVGAIASLVNQGVNGYFSKDTTKESWNKVLTMTIENFQLWKINAMKEAEHLEARFSSKLWAEKTRELYLSTL